MMGRALSAPCALLLFTLLPLACSSSIPVGRYVRSANDSFESTLMTVHGVRLSAGYCCDPSCFCAAVNNASIQQCGVIADRLATLSPSLCTSASRVSSSTLCPPSSGSAILCNGGAGCCSHSCNESCTTTKPDACVCPCEHCSTCSCCERVENRQCWLRCTPCTKVWMKLQFKDRRGELQTVHFCQNFSLNSAEARKFYDAHKGAVAIFGHFKPDDPRIVEVSEMMIPSFLDSAEEDYPVYIYRAAFATVTAFPVFLIGVLLTGLLIALLLQRRRRRADQRPFRIAWSINRGLWIGILWPLIILVLILQLPTIWLNRSDHRSFSILFPHIFAYIGWLPLLMLWLYHIIHPHL